MAGTTPATNDVTKQIVVYNRDFLAGALTEIVSRPSLQSARREWKGNQHLRARSCWTCGQKALPFR